jgi:CheY-like chemotaxis protein
VKNKKYRILVVYDERDIGSVIKRGLENEGDFEVDTFHSPQEALNRFEAGKFDLLLLDIKMPKMNGFQLYRELIKID